MQFDHAAHSVGAQQPAARGLFREQLLAQKPLQRPAQPVADGDAEAHLAALEIFRGQESPERLLQNVLRRQTPQLHSFGERGGELDDVVIQKRRARFQRDGHARDVNFDEQVVRQVRHRVGQERRVNDARAVRAREPGREPASHVRALGLAPELVRVKLALRARVEGAHPVQVALDGRQRGGPYEALEASDATAPQLRRGQQRDGAAYDLLAQNARQFSVSLGQAHRRVALVASEALVAAIAVEGHGDVPPRLARDVVGRDCGRVCVRLAVVLDESGQDLKRVGADDELVVLGPDPFGYAARVV